ncbi:hypothetical protein [Methylobacterium aquaticum]|uniref:Uncharacterized protein n=1 Tax=Methylobacterium aquaticum TaxID=270351 RepID=A0A0C6FDX2_9HYPH|nr:hypothetical protein [Methylobacterium aquaticum]BAQ46738.1 hypothetical protein Maq22A_c18205 [Methylobacterium aquaticum]
MKHTIVATALLAGLGLCTLVVPSQAMPVAASGMASGADSNLVQVRMSHRQMRRSRMRQGSASRGNAAMPSRGARGQQYGQTTGGPRR